MYQYIEDCDNYEAAMETLQALYVKPTNEVYARHLLATRRQQPAETLDEYLQALKTLSKDCNYKSVTSVVYREESIRDAFIAGLASSLIRQRLLENKTLDLKTMFDQARSLESAACSSESYKVLPPPMNAAIPKANVEADPPTDPSTDPATLAAASGTQGRKCYFCGNKWHPRYKCPARDATCSKCQKKGHFQEVCRGGAPPSTTRGASAATWNPTLATISAAVPQSLVKSTITVSIKGRDVKALVDSGSSESFIHPKLVEAITLHVHPSSGKISMATSSLSTEVAGYCLADLTHNGRKYSNLHLSVLPGLCADLILGLDFQSQHESVVFELGGSKPALSVCGLSTLNTDPPQLFANLTDDCHPVAVKSRKYSRDELTFINSEVRRLLHEGIVEPSKSPWRAQVVVTKGENHKKRMANR